VRHAARASSSLLPPPGIRSAPHLSGFVQDIRVSDVYKGRTELRT
jgi:hypothetical protein